MNTQQKRMNKLKIRDSLQLKLFGEKESFQRNCSAIIISQFDQNLQRKQQNYQSNSQRCEISQQTLNNLPQEPQRNFYDYYILGKKIGEGTQSVVYKCENILSNQVMAVKIMGNLEEQSILTLQNQFVTLRNLEHRNIISAKDLFINYENRTAYLVLQYCEYPNIREIMMKNTKIEELQIKKILSKILKAVKYFHQKGVCHRDLKPENILCSQDFNHLKIVDFDISRSSKDNEPLLMITDTGSLPYRAPESFNALYGQQVDIWSVGVIAFELFTGKLPFQSLYKNTTIKLIKQSSIEFSKLNICAITCSFLKKLLEKNPRQRLTAQNALRALFFSNQQAFNVKLEELSETETNDDCSENSEEYQ